MIEALRDRIDIVVKALHFNTRFLGELLDAHRGGDRARRRSCRAQIVFTEAEIDRMTSEILRGRLSAPSCCGGWSSSPASSSSSTPAADQFEYKTKDTAKLAGVDWHARWPRADTGRDRLKDLGSQTRNGLSVRALMTVLVFVKAMAYFRGSREVGAGGRAADHAVRAARQARAGPGLRRSSRRRATRRIAHRQDRLDAPAVRPVLRRVRPARTWTATTRWRELDAEFDEGLEGVTEREVRARLVKIERLLGEWARGRKLYGHMYDDVLKLKYLHQRYTNYLRWLQWKGDMRTGRPDWQEDRHIGFP